VRMMELGGNPDLTEEANGPELSGDLGANHLERDQPAVPEIACQVHGGHAAAPELSLELIEVRDGGWELRLAVVQPNSGVGAHLMSF
jgi:hypothetical protein